MDVQYTSLKGFRNQNEDKHNIICNLNNKNKNMPSINFFGIYDGHGGKKVSSYLETHLPGYFVNKKVKYPLNKKYVMAVYDHIQKSLRFEHKDFSYTSGSTCCVVIQFKYNNNDYINVMNTGDSRAVLCRGNMAIPLSLDHKPNWPEEKYRITKLDGGQYITKIGNDDWRIKDLSVSRSFGDVETTPYVTHRPDFYRYKLEQSDKFIILACDGLWDVVSNQEAINFVIEKSYDITTKTKLSNNANVADMLGKYAIAKGSGDNVSIIIVYLT